MGNGGKESEKNGKERTRHDFTTIKHSYLPHGSPVFVSVLRKELILVRVASSQVSSLTICSSMSVTSNNSCTQTFNM